MKQALIADADVHFHNQIAADADALNFRPINLEDTGQSGACVGDIEWTLALNSGPRSTQETHIMYHFNKGTDGIEVEVNYDWRR